MRKVRSNIEALSPLRSFKGKVVIDIGCGTGELVRDLSKQGAVVTGIDTAEMIVKANDIKRAGNETYLSGKAEKLPFEDNFADIITFFASLHHVPEGMINQALREAQRVIKPGGLVFCLEPVGEKGSYFELIRLLEDERDIQAMVYKAIKRANSLNLFNQEEYRVYFERSYEDFIKLNEVFIEDENQRNQLAEKARGITLRLSHEAGIDFKDFRFKSICRVNILTRGKTP